MSTDVSEKTDTEESPSLRVKVIGVGGAGGNIVDRLMLSQLGGLELAVVNTDQQALAGSPVSEKLRIGKSITGGLGTGGDASVGHEAALKAGEEIEALVSGVDLLFITAGLGGGVGTGAAPFIAQEGVKQGAIVISFVTLPFTIERSARSKVAREGLEALRGSCNAVIPLPNDLLIQESDPDASLLDAFSKADEWIEKAIRSLWYMVSKTGIINLDFAQIRQMLAKKAGKTLFGIGCGEGDSAAEKALASLRLCPLVHTPEFSKKADQLLVNILGGVRMGMADTQMIMEAVSEMFGAESEITMGAVVDEELGESVEICVLGTSEVSSVPVARGVAPRSRTQRGKPVAAVEEVAVSAKEKKRITHDPNEVVTQDEFSFSEGEYKGEFENADGTIFEGQDLDTPTYLRRGVKIAL